MYMNKNILPSKHLIILLLLYNNNKKKKKKKEKYSCCGRHAFTFFHQKMLEKNAISIMPKFTGFE